MTAKSDLFDALARTGKALGSGTRLEMLELLAQGERPVQELAGVAGLNLTTASAHLQVLRAAGLVVSRREGTKLYYRLAGDDVATLVTMLCRVAAAHRPDVQALSDSFMPGDDVRLLSRAELVTACSDGQVVVLDVRPREEFSAGHLPGALSIPLAELASRLSEIPADVEVVAYCRGRYCLLSHEAAKLLNAHGRRASLSEDGILEWLAAGLPMSTDEPQDSGERQR